MNTNHHGRGDSRLGGPLIWTITALLALTAIALIISILPEQIHDLRGYLRGESTSLPRRCRGNASTSLPQRCSPSRANSYWRSVLTCQI